MGRSPPKARAPRSPKNLGPWAADALSAPGQAGYAPTMNTAPPCMCYRSSEVDTGSRGADGCTLVRFVGIASRLHAATKRNLARRGKAGYCHCCALATPMVIPPVRPQGGYDASEANGLALWKKFGPWSTRGPTAALLLSLVHSKLGGCLPTLAAPDLLGRAPLFDVDLPLHAPASPDLRPLIPR